MKIKTYWHQKYKQDFAIMLAIILLPFSLSLHLLFVEYTDSFNFLGIDYNSIYPNDGVFMWHILVKLIPILVLSIWFFTSKYRWRYFILLGILPYAEELSHDFYEGNLNIYYSFASVVFVTILLIICDRLISKNRTEKMVLSISASKKIYHKFKNHFNSSLYNKNGTYEYLKKSYYSQTILNDVIENIKDNTFFSLNKKAKPYLLITLSLTPVLFYSYLLIPKELQELHIGVFIIDAHGFLDIYSFWWFVTVKLCFLVFLCVWFIVSIDWWRYAILSPIILTTYQLWEAVQTDITLVDHFEYIYASPYIVILIVFLLFISNKIKYQSKILDIYEYFSNETEELLKEIDNTNIPIDVLKTELSSLKKNINEENAKDKLQSLNELRTNLLSELEKLKDNAQ